MKKLPDSFLLICSIHAFSLDPTQFTINRITAPYFIVDANSPTTLTKAYAGFEIINNANSGVTYTNLKFTTGAGWIKSLAAR